MFPIKPLFLTSLAATAALAGSPASAQAPPPSLPAEVAAALKQHQGKWRSDAKITAGNQKFDATATWDCRPIVGGVGLLCDWTHFWPGGASDRAVEVIGYDPASKDGLTFARVTDKGIASVVTVTVRGNTLVRRWEGTQDGKPLVGVNEIQMSTSGPWTQLTTVDVDGKRTSEMRITHHRVP